MLEYLVFDLDETIYPRGSGLMQAISERISQYMIERLAMDPATVPGLRRMYWEKYGTTSRGLQLLHAIDVEDYMRYVHDVRLTDYIGPDPLLDQALCGLKQRKIVFTNATERHARAVLDVVGVAHHFEAIYDALFFGNEVKPAPGAYQRLLHELNVDGSACLLVEDAARNLRPARELGMLTVLVDPPPDAETEGADYCLARIADIGDLVKEISTKQRSPRPE
jgi:putative hydrolase of the HAD superfamily